MGHSVRAMTPGDWNEVAALIRSSTNATPDARSAAKAVAIRATFGLGASTA